MLDLWGTPFAFETVSGLKRNMTKSSIFNINAYNMIDELGDSLGCKIEKSPTIYLVFHLEETNVKRMWQGFDICTHKEDVHMEQAIFILCREIHFN